MSDETLPTDEIAAGAIGQKLRLRRKMRGLSLADVAGRANVSVGLLSQIERGLTMPSVKSMKAICGALDMPVSWLFVTEPHEDSADADIVVRQHHRRRLDLGSHGMIKELLTPDACPDIQMMRFIIQPGGHSGEPYRNQEGGKCGIVLRGCLGLDVGGRTMRIEAQDSFAFPATALIRFWAEGDEDCEVLWIVAPAVY
jgi:transcriptional regulator with XRE-family HTH domain